MSTPAHNPMFAQPPWYRRVTASARVLPPVVIIGAQAGGTTSLYTYLGEHPQVFRAKRREVHYFDFRHDLPLKWYRAFFPTRRAIQACATRHGGRSLTLESSPSYLFYPHAIKRIAATIPGVKIIVLLRNPIDRTWSQYHKSVRRQRESRSFEEAIVADQQRYEAMWAKMTDDPSYADPGELATAYVALSRYADQMEHVLAAFEPENLMVIQSEAMFGDPQGVYDQVLSFLDLPSFTLTDARPFNVGSYNTDMAADTRDNLLEYCTPDIERLYDMLGTRFDWNVPVEDPQYHLDVVAAASRPTVIRRRCEIPGD